MLGLVVLLIALLLHFTGYRRYSLLLFVFMALRYMKIVPMAVMAVNGIDLAIVYMIIVTVSQRIQTLAFTEDYRLKRASYYFIPLKFSDIETVLFLYNFYSCSQSIAYFSKYVYPHGKFTVFHI